MGLGWDCHGPPIDLDSSIIIMEDSKISKQGSTIKNIVFYGHKEDECYGVCHQGDNTTGAGSGDDEKISIDLKEQPNVGTSLVVCVTVYSGMASFSSVRNAYVRLLLPNGKVLASIYWTEK